MKTSSQNDKPKKRLEVELRDTSDQRLSCTLWGKFADSMWEACRKEERGIVICLLRCAKINTYNGDRSVSNAFDMSLMLLNPDYTIVNEFVGNLPNDNLQITFQDKNTSSIREGKDKDDYINQFPMSTISDLLEANMEGKFKIICTVYHIDMEFGWYYFECLKCKNTCYLIPKKENEPPSKTKKPLFWCQECKQEVTKVVSRYKLILDVMDTTGESKFILFDTNAQKVVGHTTTQLLNGQYDEISDPTKVPEPLTNLVGKTYMFLATVETSNIIAGKETYKCQYVELGGDNKQVDHTEDSELPTDPKDVISIDQDQNCITNSSDNGDGNPTAMTTPSSKRREDPNDENDQESTSKRLCLPSITAAIEKECDKDVAKEKDGEKFGDVGDLEGHQKDGEKDQATAT
ncbi:uncharacterized protein LOC17896650 [Capsella rubella]|uniref:uncharacterized protein LOC17896650 n=1 Tax=Capsella rubella TaxID=81985 RepID=UPI000CD5C589|nr:uncharacterized protein LOC17896650 [Capsella rubella]